MREERKLNKAIQKDGAQTQADILDELKRKYPQYVETVENKKRTPNKRRVAVFSSLAAVAVCVAVVVPCAVLLPNSGGGGSDSGYRYCADGEYSLEPSEYTLREYSEKFDNNILYFDWYDKADSYLTYCYTSNDDGTILCVQEYMFFLQSSELIYLSVTKESDYLSMFDLTIENCNSVRILNNCIVKWAIGTDDSTCYFEYDGHRYFISITAGQDETRLFELVEELLQKN